MSFLSATLLIGTLAAGIPVALHLLARQPPRRVVFPSVAFLQRQLTTQTSRLRIRRWWLLALRIIALIVFALVLARPHIDSAMASAWTTVALVALATLALLILASVAFSKGLGRRLAWSLLAVGVLLAVVTGIGAVRAIATGRKPEFANNRPLALALVIDNSPASAWTSAGGFRVEESDAESSSGSSPDTLNTLFTSALAGTRLSTAKSHAREIIDRLPSGSRVAIIDRSTSPAGFSLDLAAARSRIAQLKPIASPMSITDRTRSAIELVRTSDLGERHVVVISDMARPTWENDIPETIERSPLRPSNHEDVPVHVLNVHETSALGASDTASTAEQHQRTGTELPTINPWLSPPQVADVAPSPGVAIPIRFDVGVWRESPTGGSSGAGIGTPIDAKGFTATVQMSLYQRDPSLPVVRDGNLVLPPLRSVDRASIQLSGSGTNFRDEVILTLPPLPRGTHHAVIELIGDDRFMWDNWRFLTIDLPEPPNVLIVGDDADETRVLATAMTAPHSPGDESASYRVQTVVFRDLAAVNWKTFDMVALIDPPLRYSKNQEQIVGTNEGLSSAILEQIAGVVTRGGGLMVSLGPSSEVLTEAQPGLAQKGDTAIRWIVPPLIRSWRVPSPGTFWRISSPTHPVFNSLIRPSSMPNWSDFRVQRYWQVGTDDSPAGFESDSAPLASSWEILARYAAASNNSADSAAAAVLTRRLGEGRIAVTTTPLPALGQKTRKWNELFSASDAWPAFMTVRGLAAFLTGIDRRDATILTGQTAVVTPDTATTTVRSASPTGFAGGSSNETRDTSGESPAELSTSVELYSPGQNTGRTIPWTRPPITVRDTDTPGTYFLRGTNLWSGFSANLSPEWSRGETTSIETLRAWFGDSNWSLQRDPRSLSLTGSASGSTAVSLHAPLTLLVVIVFLAEQLLSNRFYRAARDRGDA
ncbi:MAG: BatA domain-containing protein [Rhodopirellula sp. JB044]|uniref:BatA domain-containing protein n=1 Tax=Rhodopirellula sp. JB044 TaxID=3342844 RepID=UPI00370C10C7